MAVNLNTLTTLLTLSFVFCMSIPSDTKLLSNSNNTMLSGNKSDVLYLVRRHRAAIIGHGCSKGRIPLANGCKSLKKLQDSEDKDIEATNETSPDTANVETMEISMDLSIVPLSRPSLTSNLTPAFTQSNILLTKLNSDMAKSTKVGKTLNKKRKPVTKTFAATKTKMVTEESLVTKTNKVETDTNQFLSTVVNTIPTEKYLDSTAGIPRTTANQTKSVTNQLPVVSELTPVIKGQTTATIQLTNVKADLSHQGVKTKNILPVTEQRESTTNKIATSTGTETDSATQSNSTSLLTTTETTPTESLIIASTVKIKADSGTEFNDGGHNMFYVFNKVLSGLCTIFLIGCFVLIFNGVYNVLHDVCYSHRTQEYQHNNMIL